MTIMTSTAVTPVAPPTPQDLAPDIVMRTDTILIVDDSPTDRHLAGAVVKSNPEWTTLYATNGREALEVLEQSLPDLVLTDLIMPEMDGLALVEEIHARYPNLPVIVTTAYGSQEVALQALREGAATYVSKKWLARDLIPAIEQALAARKSELPEQHRLTSLTDLESRYVLENDPADVRALIGRLRDDLGKLNLLQRSWFRLSVALEEAMLNGIYHGNLEAGSACRNSAGEFERLAAKRRQQSPYRERRLHVYTRLSPTGAVFVVRDEGPGFDYRALPDPTDPANLENSGGRGLLLIRTFMDEVIYNDSGNQITMIKLNDERGTPPS